MQNPDPNSDPEMFSDPDSNYPDLLLSCDPADRDSHSCRTPCLIVEVLSATTARIDRREKLLSYQRLPSLREYMLVEQDLVRVEIHRRANDWTMEDHGEGEVWLDCLELSLPLAEIYADVEM